MYVLGNHLLTSCLLWGFWCRVWEFGSCQKQCSWWGLELARATFNPLSLLLSRYVEVLVLAFHSASPQSPFSFLLLSFTSLKTYESVVTGLGPSTPRMPATLMTRSPVPGQPMGVDLMLSSHWRSRPYLGNSDSRHPPPLPPPRNLWTYCLEMRVCTVSTLRSKYKSITAFERNSNHCYVFPRILINSHFSSFPYTYNNNGICLV